MNARRDDIPSAESLGLSRLVHLPEVESTMDVAHELAAAGAPAGTVVLADAQTRGRGRGGHRWESEPLRGVWMTLIERPSDQRVVGVLALRLGLALADALQPLVDETVALKWPNDLLVGDRKLSGVLVEARWREASVDWVAIGIGINLAVPVSLADAASVRAGTSRNELLRAVMPGVRAAVLGGAQLSPSECERWANRDWAMGREIDEPVPGRVCGIDADGALLVERAAEAGPDARVGVGELARVRSGSLRLRASQPR